MAIIPAPYLLYKISFIIYLLINNVYAIILIMSNAYPKHIKNTPNQHPSDERTGNLKKIIGAVAIGLVLFVGGAKLVDAARPDYGFSKKTHTEVAHPGDTPWSIASNIEGADQIDTRLVVEYLIETNPNLSDGLQLGEAVEVPNKVKVN